jgi:steroid 5-alpha reductase family enzyme
MLYHQLNISSVLYKFIICDIFATIIVWLFSLIFKNSSVYDPYWSVAPIVMIWLFPKDYSVQNILMIVLITLWGVRLTYNWATTFKGLAHEDWRYRYYHDRFPKMWPLTNFFGIHLMPTIIVAMVIIPALTFLTQTQPQNMWTYLALGLGLVAICLELFADMQNHQFKINHPNKTINIGLWKYTRHPNYLGEITMWWSVYFMMLSLDLSNYWLMIGPIANTLMFIFISIPLMERRQMKNKPDYQQYKEQTSMLIPWFKRTNEINEELDNV